MRLREAGAQVLEGLFFCLSLFGAVLDLLAGWAFSSSGVWTAHCMASAIAEHGFWGAQTSIVAA